MKYFTSDQHFNHHNIIEYCKRPFKNVDEMNETIINNWNNLVTDNDDVYVLGDFCMGIPHQWNGIVTKLNGKIHLILGNHDNKKYYPTIRNIHTIKYCNVIEVVNDDKVLMIGLDHYPPFHGKHTPQEIKIDIHLCGHVHEHWKLRKHNDIPVLNVGVDVHNFRPITLDEVIKYAQA